VFLLSAQVERPQPDPATRVVDHEQLPPVVTVPEQGIQSSAENL
jgi:hypothetical protein